LLTAARPAICLRRFLIDDFGSPLDGALRPPSDFLRTTLTRIGAP
jgi:hypothetical protein